MFLVLFLFTLSLVQNLLSGDPVQDPLESGVHALEVISQMLVEASQLLNVLPLRVSQVIAVW